MPVYNVVETLTWAKTRHTITGGMNFRIMTNDRFTYAQSYPSYGFNNSALVGLGEDIQTRPSNYTGQSLNDPTSDSSALGILLGLRLRLVSWRRSSWAVLTADWY